MNKFTIFTLLDCTQNSNAHKIKYLSKRCDIFPLTFISSSYKSSIFTSYLQEGSSLVHFTFCIFLKTNKKNTSPQKLNQYLLEMDNKQRNYKYQGMKP